MKKPFELLLVLIVLGLLASPARSQEENRDTQTRFSLEEAISYALQNNTSVKQAEIDLRISKKKIWETTAIGLPQISVKGSYRHQFSVPEMDFAIPYLQNAPLTGELTTENVNKRIDSLKMGYFSNKIKLGSADNITVDFTVSQLVFSGEYIVGLQASKTFYEMSEQAYTKAQRDVREQITNAYYFALVATENVDILSTSYANTTKLVEEMTAMNKAGFIDETDVDQLRIAELNLKNALSNIERQSELALKLLKFQMGIKIDNPIELSDSIQRFINTTDFNLISANASASSNIDYQMIETQEKVMHLSLMREQSKYLPSVFAFYQHQEQVNAPDLNFMPPDVIGVSVDFPIFTSGSRMAKVSQAKMNLHKTYLAKTQVEEAINLDIAQSRIALQSAIDKFETEKQNIELSKKIYDRTVIKYREGLSSSFELTQNQNQFLTSQSNYFRAMADLLTAQTKLKKAMGIL